MCSDQEIVIMVTSMRLLSLVEGSLFKILATHGLATKTGTLSDTYIANRILDKYMKCREWDSALNLFEEIPNRDTVTWNSMIAGHVKYGELEGAWVTMKRMQTCGFIVDGYTFGSILKGVACEGSLRLGQQAHSLIVKTGFGENVYSASALLDMYCKCGKVDDAYGVFQNMPERNSVSWNSLISGYAKLENRRTSFALLGLMKLEGLVLDDGTFAPLLTLLNDPEFYRTTMMVHAKIKKIGLDYENTVSNAMITSYSECGCIQDAKKVFNYVTFRDLITWNSMLAAYLEHRLGIPAFELFLEMQRLHLEPDIYTYTSIISACFEDVYRNQGKSLHALVIKKGFEKSISICNSLIAMYLKSNNNFVEDATKVFDFMEIRDIVSWNSILTGYSQYGLSECALKFFQKMRAGSVDLDQYAFSAVLRSCSDLATLQLGRLFHGLVLKFGIESNYFVASSLIFMYSKCGNLEDARKSFEETPKDSSITWNSIIFGYAQQGQGKAALELFSLMSTSNAKLDHITFVATLTACSHMGLVDEGTHILKTMESEFGIPLRMEHYACGIDLYGRAGRLEEAKSLVESMPFVPDAMVWKTLLGACRTCGDIELASQVANHLLELEPEEHCTYILLSEMYGHLKRWDEKASVKVLMRKRGVKKVPGWSWIEIKNEVHAFNAEDNSHPYCEQIYTVLEEMAAEIKVFESQTCMELTFDLDLWSAA